MHLDQPATLALREVRQQGLLDCLGQLGARIHFCGKRNKKYVLPGRQTFVGVVNAKAAAEVDDLDVHEVLVVPRQHLRHNESTFQTG